MLTTADGDTYIGYEGAPHGVAHCDVTGCRLVGGACLHAVRAELNAILRVALSEASSRGGTLDVSAPLHPDVVGAVINAGIELVRCPGPVARAVQQTLALANVKLEVTSDDAMSGERRPDGLEEIDEDAE